eukprot:Selendium_serpulae@DN11910_c0_g1_i1.p1
MAFVQGTTLRQGTVFELVTPKQVLIHAHDVGCVTDEVPGQCRAQLTDRSPAKRRCQREASKKQGGVASSHAEPLQGAAGQSAKALCCRCQGTGSTAPQFLSCTNVSKTAINFPSSGPV